MNDKNTELKPKGNKNFEVQYRNIPDGEWILAGSAQKKDNARKTFEKFCRNAFTVEIILMETVTGKVVDNFDKSLLSNVFTHFTER